RGGGRGGVGEAVRAGRDLAGAQGQQPGGGGGGVVAVLALELLVGPAVTGRGHGNAHRGQDLARVERGEIGALVEFARRDAALAALAGEVIARPQAHHHRRHVV